MQVKLPRLFPVLLLSLLGSALSAQDNDQQLSATIVHKDSLFWHGYNACDTNVMRAYFAEDVEFYHDKGGVTMGLEALVASFKNNLCSGNFRLRREAVEGSMKVFPLRKNDVIYGAILSGEHVFYVKEQGKQEYADGLAKFTHLWMLQNGEWKMTRVLSYDHGPVPYINKRKALTLTPAVLNTYTGEYKGPQSGEARVAVENGRLILYLGSKSIPLFAEKEGLFFLKERDLTFEFVKSGNAITKMVVRERGAVAEELAAVR
ncbi:DUF4440 domain-containing protein [uncultured Chitinophaga sp.]|jgi:Domain of unknown function (DUF3471).|uniref:nuclear transport factor 2 family protein n=1 Tax=uncultured Chitinophaga sp. TaxID=339340 RepID=UPI0026020880|nr:DUF4440 domain-containing protein [uncultured Chitinophaga sp.]